MIGTRVFRGLFIFVVLALPLPCRASEHPPLDTQSPCVDCHADHAAGKYVHAALKQGCLACHVVEQRNDLTFIGQKRSQSMLCLECHKAETFAYTHLPYESAMCIRCHSPHVSSNAHLLRAAVNQLCLSCHLRNPEGLTSRYLPTITLTGDNRIGHPYAMHPVAGVLDPLTGDEMSCTSCHRAHGGTQASLLKAGAEIPEDALNQNTETNDMCRKCHMHMWGIDQSSKKAKRKPK
jgi:predicted CXXCH cytochrome family protein